MGTRQPSIRLHERCGRFPYAIPKEEVVMRLLRRCVLSGALLLALATAGLAQITGGIAGRVTDEQGGVLPGVTVEARSPALQGSRVATTDATGAYHLNLL